MLLEMLVAMAVGAFLLVALASVTSFLLRAHDGVMRRAQASEDAGRTLAALGREIGRAAPLRWAGRGAVVFEGTPARLLLARETPEAGGRIEAALFESRAAGGATELSRAESPLPPDAASPAALRWGPPVSVYRGPSRIAFAYFMALEGGGEALLDDWPAGREMPAAVRVTIRAADGPPVSLRVPLPVDAELACLAPDAPGCGRRDARPDAADPAAAPIDPDDPLGWDRYVR